MMCCYCIFSMAFLIHKQKQYLEPSGIQLASRSHMRLQINFVFQCILKYIWRDALVPRYSFKATTKILICGSIIQHSQIKPLKKCSVWTHIFHSYTTSWTFLFISETSFIFDISQTKNIKSNRTFFHPSWFYFHLFF